MTAGSDCCTILTFNANLLLAFQNLYVTVDLRLQVSLPLAFTYPLLHLQSNPGDLFTQWCAQLCLPSRHSSMSEKEEWWSDFKHIVLLLNIVKFQNPDGLIHIYPPFTRKKPMLPHCCGDFLWQGEAQDYRNKGKKYLAKKKTLFLTFTHPSSN